METLDLESMRTRDKVSIAVRVRLESQLPNREAIRRGLRLLADPRYAPQAAKSLARTLGISGTPNFIIGTDQVSGADTRQVEALIESALAES